MARFPRLSIASKFYAIFALLATATLALALVAVITARRHAALTDEFEAALQGSQNVERINGLIYAVVMDSRGVYMSEDAAVRKKYADGLMRFNEQILKLVNGWEHAVDPRHAAQFKPFAARIRQFYEFRKELARLGVEVGQAAGREWGDNDANRTVRMALNKDLETLSAHYAAQSKEIYAKIDSGIDFTALLMSFLAGAAVLLAAVGALMIWRGVVHPLALETLRRNHLPIDRLRSKSWDEFAQPGAQQLDFVFTVCDRAAQESCPVWPGQPMSAHWGIEDPALAEGTMEQQQRAFNLAFRALDARLRLFTSLPIESLDSLALQRQLDSIGRVRTDD